ncbi:MAG: HAD family hydrolase [Deltaproteobacteria bacterium]|nr:HAD family hydrolase [Deltaproteobacteria bacterium]MBW2448542.1 HAD family hydrolase [Deltaproteobacteria bacterium]
MLKAVLFDLDGVLIDSRDAWYHLLCAAAREFGHPVLARDEYDVSFGQGVEADAKQFFPGTSPQALLDYFDAHFLDHARHVIVNPEAGPVLNALEYKGIAHAVVTNTATALARETIRGAAIEPDLVVGTSDAPEKPDPGMLLVACERLGVKPEQALMVGDSRFDRDAAAAARIRFIGYGIDGDLRVEALRELIHLPEVSGA